jgi:hypothetical protein
VKNLINQEKLKLYDGLYQGRAHQYAEFLRPALLPRSTGNSTASSTANSAPAPAPLDLRAIPDKLLLLMDFNGRQ